MSRIQFVVSPNPQYIDKKADSYILLNDSVLRDENEKIFKGKFSILRLKEKNEQEYLETKEYIRKLSDRVIAHYGEVMNSFVKVSLSERQWKYFIGIWLHDFLFDAYDRYIKIKSMDTDDVYTVAGTENSVLSNQREYGFINGYHPDYQMQLYSHIFRLLKKPVYRMKNTAACRVCNKIMQLYLKWKTRFRIIYKSPDKIIKIMKKRYEKKIHAAGGNVLVVESRMPELMEREIASLCGNKVRFISGLYFCSCMNPIIKKTKPDFLKRKKWLKGFEGKNEFEMMTDALLVHFLPVSFFEAFSQLYDRAVEITRNWQYRKIYHSAHITELFALCCAMMKDKGTLICDIQHSAAYNDIYCMGFKEFEVWDRFLTWGWHADGLRYQSVYPVAMNRLPSKKSSNYKVKDKILLATGIPELSDTGAGWSYVNYVRQQKEFISSLSESMRKKLVIRVRTDSLEMSGGLIDWCKKNYPYIKIEIADNISFTDSLMESRLLVCDYFGSPHLEALMLDKAFVMFEGARIIVHNPAIKKYIKEMKKIGLYKERGKDLAVEISSHSNIEKWIASLNVRVFLEEYKNEMTNTDKNIIKLWADEFMGK